MDGAMSRWSIGCRGVVGNPCLSGASEMTGIEVGWSWVWSWAAGVEKRSSLSNPERENYLFWG